MNYGRKLIEKRAVSSLKNQNIVKDNCPTQENGQVRDIIDEHTSKQAIPSLKKIQFVSIKLKTDKMSELKITTYRGS